MEGMPDEDGLIQAIRPAQEKFRSAIRQTAPEFRPFEKRYAEGRTFGSPLFLRHEEGGVSDMENGVGEASSELGDQAPERPRKIIYIDEVLDHAHK
jgi:hypothetical protein